MTKQAALTNDQFGLLLRVLQAAAVDNSRRRRRTKGGNRTHLVQFHAIHASRTLQTRIMPSGCKIP
jgi:hypothetical protein